MFSNHAEAGLEHGVIALQNQAGQGGERTHCLDGPTSDLVKVLTHLQGEGLRWTNLLNQRRAVKFCFARSWADAGLILAAVRSSDHLTRKLRKFGVSWKESGKHRNMCSL